MHAAPPAPTLVQVARALAAGAATVDDLRAAFADSPVYCERTGRPGFTALGAPGAGVVPAFTSTEQLAVARGPVPWFSLPGAELLDLLPAGYDILLDIGGTTPLRLRPVDGRLEAVTTLDRPSGPSGPSGTCPAFAGTTPGRPVPAAGLLAAVGEAAAGLRYGTAHNLPFARRDDRPRRGWDAWRRWSDRRDLGRVSVHLVASATRAGAGAATAWRAWRRTAFSVFGRTAATAPAVAARRDRPRPAGTGRRTASPIRAGRHGAVEVWRTNLHTPPRSARPERVWTGRGSNPLARATVAASLPIGEQEVRRVVLRSGPPAVEEPDPDHPDPGRSR